MKNTILITGINGFLGSHLAKSLKDRFEIIGLANSTDNLYRLDGESFKIYSSKKDLLETIFLENKIFSILHVATVYNRQDETILPLLKANILLPIQLMELAIKYNVSIFINSDTFFNNKKYSYSYLPEYILSKKNSLEWIRTLGANSNCKVINMKIFHMYGSNDSENKFIPLIIDKIKKNTKNIDMTSGIQTRDFVYIKDVVTAFDVVLKSWDNLLNYEDFEIGSGISHSVKYLAEIIKKITNSNSELNFGAIAQRKGEIMESHVEKFNLQKYGWMPKFSLEKGLKDYLL
jgi:CDP-paratose synthetase